MGQRDSFPTSLAIQWREDAKLLRRRGAESQATAIESCAADLEAAEATRLLESLTLQEAVEQSGYSYSALQKMVAGRRLQNAGTAHRPRVRRSDLPRKAPCSAVQPSTSEPEIAVQVLAAEHKLSHIS